jgi:hypothetical protein
MSAYGYLLMVGWLVGWLVGKDLRQLMMNVGA